jgi:DNA invertase Pin-like site-specific DNA recombinase
MVIDDDLGKSAISASDRSGFQTLVSAVGLAKVGIILVTDVSRLARNCTDWYQLLDIASLCGTLIGDASGVYDPRDYNDRMLLGLKGTFSEAQWYHMRMHLYAALLNKARRGELAIRLPIGYERTADGQIVLSADQEVQSAIRLVFAQFDRLGSARAVLLWLHDQHLQLPRCIQNGPDAGQIEWVKPSYPSIYRILKHPAYAGSVHLRQTGKHPPARQRAQGSQPPFAQGRMAGADSKGFSRLYHLGTIPGEPGEVSQPTRRGPTGNWGLRAVGKPYYRDWCGADGVGGGSNCVTAINQLMSVKAHTRIMANRAARISWWRISIKP